MISPGKVVAGSFGLSAFAVAVIAGLGAGNTASDVLIRALVAMVVCYFIGTLLGGVGERTVSEHVRQYIEGRVVPDARSVPSVPPVKDTGTTGGKDGGKVHT